MVKKAIRWEGWRCGTGLAFFPVTHSPQMRDVILGPGPRKKIFTCWAKTYNEAMTKWHEFNRWEPYKPLEGVEDE